MRYRPRATFDPDGSNVGVCAADHASEYLARKESLQQTRLDRLAEGAAGSEDLAELLQVIGQQQRLQARALTLTSRLTITGEAEQVTQLPLSMWLSMAGRLTRRETNLLLNGVDVLADMPAIASALQAGSIAWGQITGMIGRLRSIRAEVRRSVDEALAEFLDDQQSWEPDELVARIDRLIDAATPDRDQADADAAADNEFLHIQPDLFGHKGRVYGELGTPTLVRLTDHLDQIANRLGEDLPGKARTRLGARPDGGKVAGQVSKRRARALSAWVFNPALGCPGNHNDDGTDGGTRIDLRVIATLDSLLGRDGTPAEVLTSLTGRRLKITSPALRALLDHHGANISMMFIEDHGQVIGVGGTNYQPPGWLRRVVETMWPQGIAPGRTTTAVTADIDHHIPWPTGLTNLDNLGPLARGDHRLKDTDGWTVETIKDGWRRWKHAPSGMVIDKPPWTHQPRPPRLDDLPDNTGKPWRTSDPNAPPPPPTDTDAPPQPTE